MVALVMVLGGAALIFVGGSAASMAVLDTSGAWWVRLLGLLGAVGAVAGLVLVVRGLGFGWIGAP